VQEIIEYMKGLKSQKQQPKILIHDDADADALGAAYAISRLVGGNIIVPRSISEHGQEIMERLGFKVSYGPRNLKEEEVIILDTADIQQLPEIELGSYVVIDHHRNNKLLANSQASYHSPEDSTCQLVFQIFKELGFNLDEKLALALAGGILGDTIYLEKAENKTIILLGEILEDGNISYRKALSLMQVSRRISREIKLKAALKARLFKLKDNLVVFTQTEPDYVYYVAMMFIELGADISLILSQSGEETSIRLVKKPGHAEDLDLLEIMKKGIGDSEVENLWGDKEFVGFKGIGDDFQIIKDVLYELSQP